MNVKYEWLDRLRAVDREAIVIGAAVARLRIALADGTLTLPSGTSARDLATASGQLEASCFEARLGRGVITGPS